MEDWRRKAELLAAVEQYRQKLDQSRQILPSFMLGAAPGGAASAQVLPFPAKPISDQRRAEIMFADQMPRLNAIAADRFRVADVPALPAGDRPITKLFRVRDETPLKKEMLGHEELRYGAQARAVEKLEPFYVPSWSKPEWMLKSREHGKSGLFGPNTAREYAAPEDARRAALIEAIKYFSHRPDSFKPVKPQISEFASPESARQSWRLID